MNISHFTQEDLNLLATLDILYVEDEDTTRKAFSGILSRFVKSLTTAENGLRGLELFKESEPDMVITDVEMPIMGGVEMVLKIREISPKKTIIVITAFKDEAHKIDDADLVLVKPIRRDVLLEALISEAKKLSHILQ